MQSDNTIMGWEGPEGRFGLNPEAETQLNVHTNADAVRQEMEEYNNPSSEKEFKDYQNSKIRSNFPLALRIAVDIMVHTGKYRLSKPDYANLRYYTEALLNFIKNKKPGDIEQYLLDHSKEKLPRSSINCNQMRQFIFYLAQRYKGQYGN